MTYRVGILLDHQALRGIPHKRTGFEKISYYNLAAKKLNLIPFYMSLNHTNPKQNRAKGYEYIGEHRFVTRQIPKVIHNRSMCFSKIGRQTLQALKNRSAVFNGHTRYSKLYIHKLLNRNESLRPHLPQTLHFSKKNLETMMTRYSSLFIKPISGSLGKGIYKIKKGTTGWTIYSKEKSQTKKESEVYKALIRKIGKNAYLIQQAIPLATYKGQPFDIRVSVQRGSTGEWQVTGMVGKVAGKGKYVTNVASGGRVVKCEELFSQAGLPVEGVKKKVGKLGLQIAKDLSKKLDHLADIGLDIGIDKAGFPYFIEMNGRDLRYSFRNAKLYDTWYETYANPMKYAWYLYKK